MSNFDFNKWLLIIEESRLKIKNEIQDLYKIKNQIDAELRLLFVDRITVFYKELYRLYDSYSMENPEPIENTKEKFISDLADFMNAYSELLYFNQLITDLTGKKIDYPNVIYQVWTELKHEYISDFIDSPKLDNDSLYADIKPEGEQRGANVELIKAIENLNWKKDELKSFNNWLVDLDINNKPVNGIHWRSLKVLLNDFSNQMHYEVEALEEQINKVASGIEVDISEDFNSPKKNNSFSGSILDKIE